MKIFFLLLGLDQLTKYLATKTGLVHYNSGLSFGLGGGVPLSFLILGVLLILIWVFRKIDLPNWFKSLFFAGAISNLVDRFLFMGQVRDWLPIPVFNLVNNLADWYIFSAVAIYVLKYLYDEYRKNLRR